jgi:hypothetical protein
MEALPWDARLYGLMLDEWARGHGLPPAPVGSLPRTGRIIPGVCAAFVYRTDSNVGFIESLVSNPDCDYEKLGEAIKSVVAALEKDAARAGILYLVGSTFIPGIVERVKDMGFEIKPEKYKLFTKRVTG